MAIPDFRDDGRLPEGLHPASESEVTFRFGLVTPCRRRLSLPVELEMMLLTRQPEEIYAAGTQRDWEDWVQYVSLTREADGRRKGLVEVEL